MEDRPCDRRLFSVSAWDFGNITIALGINFAKRGCNFAASQRFSGDHLLRFRRNRVEYST